jgi:ketosteroid isomerase-like protein
VSAENVESLRKAYEAFSRGDFDAAIELAHPEIEFDRVGGQSRIRGAKAFRAWMEPDAIEDARLEPLEFRINGDKVLVRQVLRGRGAGSGIELENEAWAVWTFDEDGLATRVEGFGRHEASEALEAVGLSD